MNSSNNWFQASSICLLNSQSKSIRVQPITDPAWMVTQPGITSGAVLVERLRTFDGRVHNIELNCARLRIGASCFGWDPAEVTSAFETLVEAVLKTNQFPTTTHFRAVHNDRESPVDVSLVVLFYPEQDGGWQAISHLAEIPFARLHRWYSQGVILRSIPGSFQCLDQLPTEIKHRSRIGYWLADQQANRLQSGSMALLQNSDGVIADTSFANLIAITDRGEWITPSEDYCHLGITIRRTEALLFDCGIHITKRPVLIAELENVSEIFLVGSTGIATPVSQLDGRRLTFAQRTTSNAHLHHETFSFGKCYASIPSESHQEKGWKLVNRLWADSVGIHVEAQAKQFGRDSELQS